MLRITVNNSNTIMPLTDLRIDFNGTRDAAISIIRNTVTKPKITKLCTKKMPTINTKHSSILIPASIL